MCLFVVVPLDVFYQRTLNKYGIFVFVTFMRSLFYFSNWKVQVYPSPPKVCNKNKCMGRKKRTRVNWKQFTPIKVSLFILRLSFCFQTTMKFLLIYFISYA